MTEPSNEQKELALNDESKDLVLSDGRKVELDLNAISISEYREMLKKDQSDEEEYALLGKITGIENIGKLGFQDYRKILAAFFDKLKDPVNPT